MLEKNGHFYTDSNGWDILERRFLPPSRPSPNSREGVDDPGACQAPGGVAVSWEGGPAGRTLAFRGDLSSPEPRDRAHQPESGLLTTPEEFEIKNMGMKSGATLKIKGKITNDADGFVINLGQRAEKLNLHFNPRFKESTIVCNSFDGCWGQEQRNHLCFRPGSDVKFIMTFEKDQFKVTLPDGHVLTFPNRLGHCHLSYLSVKGGFQISSFKSD
ncbi:LOW QUALITY PROTEIN: galectin-2 [Dugong dugon]